MPEEQTISAGARIQAVSSHERSKVHPSSVHSLRTASTHTSSFLQHSTRAIRGTSRKGLQRPLHPNVQFLWLQAETAAKRFRISKVPGPEGRRRLEHPTCRQTFARILSYVQGSNIDRERVSRSSLVTTLTSFPVFV